MSILFCTRASLAGDRFSKEDFFGDDDAPWHITAKNLTYKAEEGVYIAEGDVVISQKHQVLYAQNAVYNSKTGIATATGDVRFESGRDILTGDHGIFNLGNHTGTITNGRLFLADNHYYISGNVMEKVSEDTYLVKDCKLTTCDGTKPAWTITGSEVRVTMKGYGTVDHATFRFLGVPVLYVPYIIFPARTKRQTGLLTPRVGYSSRNGMDTEIPFFWAISDQTDATFYQRYMSERGYMQGLEFRYVADEHSKGDFLFDILSDKKAEKDMTDTDEVELSPYERNDSTRYWFRSKVDQDLPFGLTARLDTDVVSDQDYLREFESGLFGLESRPDLAEEFGRPVEEKTSPTRRSALRLSQDAEDYSLQALASYHQRPEDPSEDDTAQPLTGLNFVLLPEMIMDLPIFFSLDSDYDYVWREDGVKGHRIWMSPELRFPIWLFGRYLEFEPTARYLYNVQWVDDAEEEGNHLYKKAYEAGASLAASAERIYDFGWGNVTKLKHKISPVLSYTYRVREDEEDYSPWFEPIENIAGIDETGNLISFSLENYLDARLENKGVLSYRQWATFNLSQAYDIDEARRKEDPETEKEPFQPLAASLTVYPTSDLYLNWSTGWDHYDKEISYKTLSLYLTLPRSGGREDTYEVNYLNYTDGDRSLRYRFDVNLAYGFLVGSSLERDLELGKNISNSYWLGYRSQCWGVKLVAERTDEDTSVMVAFQLLGLVDVGSW